MMKKICVLVSLAVVLFSCNKQPTASFDLSQTYLFAGDGMKLTSTSKDAESYSWTFTDSEWSEIINTQEATHYFRSFGDLPISLTVYSKHKKKSSSITKSIKVYGDYNYEVNGKKYIAYQNTCRAIIEPDGLNNLIYWCKLGIKAEGSSDSGIDYLSIGLRNQSSSKTKLTDAEFDELFKIGNIVNLNPKNYVQMELNVPRVFAHEFDSISVDNFKIINTIPYGNGLIVEANFSFTAGVPVVYNVKNGYVSFWVKR
jgi:hypothetical protein